MNAPFNNGYYSNQRAKLPQIIPFLRGLKRRSLFAKLNAFENEVDQDLTRTAAFFEFAIRASKVAKEVGATFDPVMERVDRLLDMVDGAKKWVETLPSWRDPKKLEGPAKQIEGPVDDDLPF